MVFISKKLDPLITDLSRCNGVMTSLRFSEPVSLKTSAGKLCLTNWIRFHENGFLESGTLTNPQQINTPAGKFKVNGSFEFNSKGFLTRLQLQEPVFWPTLYGKIQMQDTLYFYDHGMIKHGKMVESHMFQVEAGLLDLSGFIHFYPQGQLKSGYLTRPQKVLLPSGELRTLKGEIKLDPHGKVIQGEFVDFQPLNTSLGELDFFSFEYHPETFHLKTGTLKRGQQNSTPYGNLGFSEIQFYSNGIPENAVLSKPQEVQTPAGILKLKGEIDFYKNGTISSAVIFKTQKIQTSIGEVEACKDISFHENGSLEEINLAKPVSVFFQEKFYKIRNSISFNEKGGLSSLKLLKPSAVQTPLGDLMGDSIFIDDQGRISSIYFDRYEILNLPQGTFYTDMVDFEYNGDMEIRLYKSGILLYKNLKLKIRESISFRPDWSIKDFFTDKPVKMKTHLGDQRVKGHICLYADGSLESGFFEKEQWIEIGGVCCFYHEFKLYLEGRLKEVDFKESYLIQTPLGKIPIKKVELETSGSVCRWHCEEKDEIQYYLRDLLIKSFSMHANGTPFEVFVAQYKEFFGEEFSVKAITFNSTGKIEQISVFSGPEIKTPHGSFEIRVMGFDKQGGLSWIKEIFSGKRIIFKPR